MPDWLMKVILPVALPLILGLGVEFAFHLLHRWRRTRAAGRRESAS